MHRFAFVVSAVALCGQTTPPAATGSISGVVQYENGKAPEAGIVRISPGGYEIKLDDKGHYSQHDLKPGTYHISAETNRGWGPSGSRLVALGTGQDMTADLRLRPNAGITGRVLDENKEPVAGASVFLIAREYQLGELRYVRAFVEQTNDQGEYMVAEVPPDRGYLLLAKKTVHEVPPISDSPVDVKLRKRILIPTYYPGVDSVEGAEVVTLSSGARAWIFACIAPRRTASKPCSRARMGRCRLCSSSRRSSPPMAKLLAGACTWSRRRVPQGQTAGFACATSIPAITGSPRST
jgi:hypothetical protein